MSRTRNAAALSLLLLLLQLPPSALAARRCGDGSAPGSNGCCADTGGCPLGCLYSSTGHNSPCTCGGCCGDPVTLDAACITEAGCKTALGVSDLGTRFSMMGCGFCLTDNESSDAFCMTSACATTSASLLEAGLSMSVGDDGVAACTDSQSASAAAPLGSLAALPTAAALFVWLALRGRI